MTAFLRISIFCFLFIAVFSYSGKAQEGNIWYFGEFAGLDFNFAPPKALLDGMIKTREGSSTVADKNGRLLFYTDGVTVFNRNHKIMPNGNDLYGHSSSTHSAIVIPFPANAYKYYVFTSDAREHSVDPYGYNYSIVDMTLNGGLGDVIEKNTLMYTPSTEKIAAVKASNGIDYWLVTKEMANNRYKAYKIDCSGFNPTPIMSDVGSPIATGSSYTPGPGQMKISPDGKKIASVFTDPIGFVELFDFNNTTGAISNPIHIPGLAGSQDSYGVEFSPNSKLIYIGSRIFSLVNQYDISSGDEATIIASKYTITVEQNLNGLQLTPDKRIVIAIAPNFTHLPVINKPDVYGSGCDYNYSGIDLAGRKVVVGLPAYTASLFDNAYHANFTHSFINCYVQFTGSTDLTGAITYEWDFGDGGIGIGQIVKHSYRQVGTYNVTLKVRRTISTACKTLNDSAIFSKPVDVNSVFAVDYKTVGTCIDQPYQFNDDTKLTVGSIVSRTWDFGDGTPTSNTLNPTHTFLNPGVYDVKLVIATSGVCSADSMIKKVSVDTKPVASFTPIKGCVDEVVSFKDNSTNSFGAVNSWQWNFGDGSLTSTDKDPQHIYSIAGQFPVSLQATSIGGCPADLKTEMINITDPVAFAGKDTSVTYAAPFLLHGTGGVSFLWTPPTGLDNPFKQNPIAVLTDDAYYVVEVTDANGCKATDDIRIKVNGNPDVYVPTAFTPNGDGNNDALMPLGFALKKLEYFRVYNRYGELVFQTSTLNKGWDGTFKGKPQPMGAYTYLVKAVNYKDRVLEQMGTSILLW